MGRFHTVTKQITMAGLKGKVDFISGLTGIDFKFSPGTAKDSKGYLMRPANPEKASPFLPGGLIGRTRHEANRNLDAILAGIGFVAGVPMVRERGEE